MATQTQDMRGSCLTSSDTQAVLPPESLIVGSRTLSNGVTLKTAWTQALMVVDGNAPSMTGNANTTVLPGAPPV